MGETPSLTEFYRSQEKFAFPGLFSYYVNATEPDNYEN